MRKHWYAYGSIWYYSKDKCTFLSRIFVNRQLIDSKDKCTFLSRIFVNRQLIDHSGVVEEMRCIRDFLLDFNNDEFSRARRRMPNIRDNVHLYVSGIMTTLGVDSDTKEAYCCIRPFRNCCGDRSAMTSCHLLC